MLHLKKQNAFWLTVSHHSKYGEKNNNKKTKQKQK